VRGEVRSAPALRTSSRLASFQIDESSSLSARGAGGSARRTSEQRFIAALGRTVHRVLEDELQARCEGGVSDPSERMKGKGKLNERIAGTNLEVDDEGLGRAELLAVELVLTRRARGRDARQYSSSS
jgi:hypothetical protein